MEMHFDSQVSKRETWGTRIFSLQLCRDRAGTWLRDRKPVRSHHLSGQNCGTAVIGWTPSPQPT